ncbi:MAG: hypothetical protein ACYTDY_12840, partial [Planctomycetota bacterium]
RGGDRGGGGIGQGPIIAVIAIGGVLAIVLLVILLTQGGGSTTYVPPATTDPATGAASAGSPKKGPLTDEQKKEFREMISRLAPGERKAKMLIREGFEAQDQQDYDVAQRQWKKAYDTLRGMIEEAETMAMELGEERVEKELGPYYASVGKWSKLLSDIQKQLK